MLTDSTADRFKPGDVVRVVSAQGYPHLVDTRAVVVAGRAWRRVRSATGERYQIFAYKIRGDDGRIYGAEEYTVEPWQESPPLVPNWRREATDLNTLERTTGWRPQPLQVKRLT